MLLTSDQFKCKFTCNSFAPPKEKHPSNITYFSFSTTARFQLPPFRAGQESVPGRGRGGAGGQDRQQFSPLHSDICVGLCGTTWRPSPLHQLIAGADAKRPLTSPCLCHGERRLMFPSLEESYTAAWVLQEAGVAARLLLPAAHMGCPQQTCFAKMLNLL